MTAPALPTIGDFLSLERRVLTEPQSARAASTRLSEPREAREILAAIAAVHPAGSAITVEQACKASHRGKGCVLAVRRWAIQEGLWPYRLAGRLPSWANAVFGRKGGGT